MPSQHVVLEDLQRLRSLQTVKEKLTEVDHNCLPKRLSERTEIFLKVLEDLDILVQSFSVAIQK
jgi:hypothetical protein